MADPTPNVPTRTTLTLAVTNYAAALCDHERGDPQDFAALDKVARTRNALGLVVDALYARIAQLEQSSAPSVAPREPTPPFEEQDARYLERLATEIDGSELTLHWRQDVAFLQDIAAKVRCQFSVQAPDEGAK